MKVKIREIKLKDRIREDIGDLTELQASIMKLGLIHPILITRDYRLVSGARRLAACKNLGFEEIEANIAGEDSPLNLLELEVHENLIRKDFTEEEIEKILRKKNELLKNSFLRRFIHFLKTIYYSIIGFFQNLFKREKGK